MNVAGDVRIYLKSWSFLIPHYGWKDMGEIHNCRRSRELYQHIVNKFKEDLGYKLNAISHNRMGDVRVWTVAYDATTSYSTLRIRLITSDEDITLGKFKAAFDDEVRPILEEYKFEDYCTMFDTKGIRYSQITLQPSEEEL